jgi:GYF domain 2
MSQFASTELAPDDWMVAVAPGNVHTMSVDQLDAAFQAGQISEQTMVWTHGMEAWLPLEEVLGGGSDASDELPAPAAWPAQPVVAAQPMIAAQPVAHQPMIAAQPVAHQPMIAAQPVAHQPMIAAQPVQQAIRSQQATITGPAYPSVASSLVPAALPSALSTAPVAMNNLESLDLDVPAFGKKKSKLGLFAAAAVVLGGIGFTVANAGGITAAAPAAAAAAAHHASEGDKPLAAGEVKANPNAPLVTKGGYNVTEAEAKAFAKEEAANKEAAALKEKELQTKATEALSGKPGAKPDKASAKAATAAMKAKFSGGGGKKASKSGGGAPKGGGSTFDPLNGNLP